MGSRKIKALSAIQRPFALNISKAYRTTATNAALVLTGLTPLHIRAKLEAIYERVIRLKENAALDTTVFSTLQYETPGSTQHVHPAHKNSGIHVKIAKRSTPRIEDVPVASQFYTDGSKHDNGVGCAYAYYEHGTLHSQWKGHLAAHNSIFQAEPISIEAAIQYAHDIQLARTEICTDSMSVLQALKNHHHTSTIIMQIQQTLHSNQQSNIKLKWVRGHSGIAGNEKADQLANEAAINNNAQAVSALIPPSFLKRQLRDIGNKQWQHEWENGDTGRRTFEFYPVVDKERLQAIPPLVNYITGHGPFPTFFYKRAISMTEACVCGEIGSPDHYVFNCSLTTSHHLPYSTTDIVRYKRFIIKHAPAIRNICKIIQQLSAPRAGCLPANIGIIAYTAQ
ncbi:uncharacterized protein LOC118197859 [Stegodyphus dumicola]|uniref:uncharacterized protein LOC118197859 n=1 Tax=Stegodyphus dumicola TaxID=202533 RepID=UPI0015ACF5B9|nr:uncharacterized protein LOC118197859 [Stegodyphus dumicola]